jgi:Zn-dependent metalloprotease
MKKISLTLCVLVLIMQVSAQTSLKAIIRDDRAGTTHRFVNLEDNEQVPFNQASVKRILGLDPLSDLVLMGKETDELGYTHYRFYQTYKGIPVENSMYILHVKNGRLTGMSGEIVMDFDTKNQQSATAAISKQSAISAALNVVQAKKYMWQNAAREQRIKNERGDPKATYAPGAQLVWFNDGESINPHNLRLAYKVDVNAEEPLSLADYFIDAQSGKFAGKKDKINTTDATGTAATVYSGVQTIHSDFTGINYRLRDYTKGNGVITMHGESGLFGTDYTNGSATWALAGTNKAALDAHYGVSQTYEFYRTVLGRNSVNNAGLALNSYVNDPAYLDNAYWDQVSKNMHFCKRSDGNPGGVTGIDVCGHELTHGVTQFTSGLSYSKEPGAMNESMSDIMGKSVQFWSKPSDINWKLSNDMGWIIRDMANPNAEGQPDTYKGTYWQNVDTNPYDNYGVHTNSGVGNFMFYLLVNGGSGVNDLGHLYSVTGIGLTAAERIVYRTNAVYLTPTSKYADWRTACINAATDLYGAISTQVTQVKNAWYAVGIGSGAGGNVYCTSAGNSAYEYINNVKLGTINNTSGNNSGYHDYTSLNTALTANTTYSIQLTPGFSGIAYTEYWAVYIDYNQNGKLNDPGEKVATGSSTSTSAISLAFKVPKNVLNGKTRMRVQMKYGSATSDPCVASFYGEVEDYSVTISGGINYCASAGNSTYYEYINKVALGSINNTSGNNFGYGNYKALSTNLTELFSYNISLTPGFTSGAFTEYWAVYIDYNRNGSFADAGETVATGSGTGAITKTFTIPLTASTGPTRMRVKMQYGSAPASSCGTISFGEVEDYTVNILSAVIKLPDAFAADSSEDAATKQPVLAKSASVSVVPNPVVAGNARIAYTPNGNGPVSLKLIDLSGRVLKTVSIGNKTAGSYTQALNEIAGFKAGSYIIVMEQNGRVTARNQFIIAR